MSAYIPGSLQGDNNNNFMSWKNIDQYLYIIWVEDKPKLIRNMLAALEKGQDEMISAVKPPKLKKLMEPYRNIANSNPASGTLLSIIKYLFLSLTNMSLS